MSSIYIIKSKTSEKSYIGQTNSTTEKRWKKHLDAQRRNKTTSALYLAIEKYGIEDFEVKSIVDGNMDKKQLNELEVKYIAEMNTLSPKGYNLNGGGNSNVISEETRKRKSNALKGRNMTWGNKVSLGVKKLWSDPEYRAKQIAQRYAKRGKYKTGIIREKLRFKLDILSFKKDYYNDLKVKDICKKYNLSVSTMYRIIKRESLNKRRYLCHKNH